ncbi:DUF624 domain-containing protein [Bacillus sp. FJAT-50079]|uniref:YesL family protein n=1 Tax=Bacillus sp. FJAT-50079 TaxID=2833577 RepID=UPI001BCA1D6E|nr:DUF624 domain-containing protein [Bacillus sp. FJAT-50079]MBS4207915.1 DUF624 domain-containing protein [Bacillus sp. FJAT-50079]
MSLEGIVWKLYEISNWLMKLILLNSLWLLFSLLGIVIFGFFPATSAMFAVTRKWILGDTDIPIFKTFWNTYRSSFLQSNILGSLLLLLGLVLYVDLRFFQSSEHIILSLLNFFIIFAFIIYFAVVLYIFPIYVHFKCRTMEYIKRSIIIVLGKPLHSIMMVVGSYIVYIVISMVPVLFIFISGSLASLLLMWIAMKAFARYDVKVGEVD